MHFRTTQNRLAIALSFAVMLCCAIGTRGQRQTQYDKGTPPQHAVGVSSIGAYLTTELGTINLSNGALNFKIPLGTIGGRGDVAFPLSLDYSSKVWSASIDTETKWSSECDCYVQVPVAYADYDRGLGQGVGFARMIGAGWSLGTGMRLEQKFVKISRILSGPNAGYYNYLLPRLTLYLPDRGEIEFRDDAYNGAPLPITNYQAFSTASRGTRWHATDGSGAIFVNAVDNGVSQYPLPNLTGTVILADGTRFDTSPTGVITDRNGNRIESVTNGYLDPLGRLTKIESNVPDPQHPNVTLAVLVTLPGYQGTPRYYKVKKGLMHDNYRSGIAPSLPVITGDWDPEFKGYTWPGNPTRLFSQSYGRYAQRIDEWEVVTELELPDGRSLKFRYNEFGEVAEVELPTGAKIQYSYQFKNSLPSGNSPVWETGTDGRPVGLRTDVRQVDRAVVGKSTYADGVNLEGSWTYQPCSQLINGTTYQCMDVSTYSNASTLLQSERHFFLAADRYTEAFNSQSEHDGTYYNLWSTGIEWRSEIRDGNGTVLSATEQDWSQRAPVSWPTYVQEQPANDNRVNQARHYLENGMMAKTETTYDQYNNPIEVREYDYDQSLKRKTTTTYLTSNNGFNYATDDAIHMLSLPVTATIFNGTGTQVAQTVKEYDVYTNDGNHALLTDYASVSKHDSNYGPAKTTRGNVTRVGQWLNTTNSFIYSYFRFDTLGNVVSIKDANGQLTSFSFADDFGPGDNPGSLSQNPATPTYALPTLITSPPPLPGAPVHTARTQYDYSTGLLTGFRDRNNVVTQTIYNDPFNRPTQVKSALGVSGVESHATSYYAPTTVFGITLAKNDVLTVSDLNTLDDASIRSWTVTDGFGRSIEAWRRDPQGDVKVVNVYDALGRVKQTSNPFRPASESAVYTTTAYDLTGRVTSVTTPDNAAVGTSYSGNTVTMTDQAGKARKSVTDALGRLSAVYEDPSGLNYQTSYTYDVLDNLTTVTQGAQTRTFVYDSLKRLRSATNPESGTVTYNYDNNSNLTQKTDARGVVTTYAYDAFNRNTTIDYSDTPSINPDVTRFYDGAINGKGRFWYFYSGGSNLEHTAIDNYDALGRPTVQRQLFKVNGVWAPPSYQTTRTYNLAGSVTSQTYPSGHTVSYSYDSAGRTNSFSGNLGDGTTRTYSTAIDYDAFGGMRQEQFGTQIPVYHKKHYNRRGQLFDTRVSTVSWATDQWNWNRGALVNYYSSNYAWEGNPSTPAGPDNNGNVLLQQHWVPGDDAISNYTYTQDYYAYDALNRIQSVAEYHGTNVGESPQDFAQMFTYDRWGNRTINPASWGVGINTKQFTVDPNNRLGVPTGQSGSMIYDNAGNLTTDTYTGVGTRTYDAENKMITATDNTGQISRYTYNAEGKRVRRQVASSQEEWLIYGIDGELLVEYQAGASPSAPEKEYGYRNGQLLVTATGRFNVALAANGGVATASSAHTCCGFSTSGAINGNYRGPWGSGEGWNDATPDQLPDWFQVDFAGSKTIDEIDVFSLHDNYTQENTPPTETQTFTLYGLLAFEVQYWNGSSWVTVPGGSVSGNNKVWRKFTFAPITTSKIRLWITSVPDSWSRLVELQAWGTGGGVTNLAVNKPATQSSTGWDGLGQRGADGNTDGNFANGSVTHTLFETQPWWQVDLQSVANIQNINVWNRADCCGERLSNFYVFVSDNPFTANDVASTQNQPGVSTYYVAGQGGVPSTISVNRTGRYVRVQLGGSDYLSVAEVQVFGGGGAEVRWLVPDHLGTPRIIVDQSGSLAGVKRHDYLPFGEELLAPAGGRTTAQGYSSSEGVRQQFTQKERDVETGLDYFLARYYSSSQGRFTSIDSYNVNLERQQADNERQAESLFTQFIGNPQRWNSYGYALNNPVKYVDPNGQEPQDSLELNFERDVKALQSHKISEDEFRVRMNARGVGAVVGLAIVAAAYASWEVAVTALVWAAQHPEQAEQLGLDVHMASTGSPAPGSPATLTLSGATHLSIEEAATGARLAAQLGEHLTESTHVGAEFVSAAGRTFDAMGTPQAFAHWNAREFTSSIVRHVNKSVDYVAIDLTGASKSQIQTIKKFVSGLSEEQKNKIIYVQ